MDFIPYNSRLSYHKSRFGAVREGEEITFRIVMPRSFCCTGANLIMTGDSGEYYCCPMSWERMEGEHEEWWKVDFTPKKSGLYWYHFDYCSSYGRSSVLQTENGIGGFAGSQSARKDWQLTVTEKDFTKIFEGKALL